MLYAELTYPEHYSEVHDELVEYLEQRFAQVQSGLQGDSWVWIFEGDDRVAIDTFYSMKHQVKATQGARTLAHRVIAHLAGRYELVVPDPPQPEPDDE